MQGSRVSCVFDESVQLRRTCNRVVCIESFHGEGVVITTKESFETLQTNKQFVMIEEISVHYMQLIE